MNRKHRKNIRVILAYIFILLCFAGVGYSSFNITKWYLDSTKTQKKIYKVQDIVDIQTVSGGEVFSVDTKEIDPTSPYWTYIGMDLISVDFTKLKETNSDIVGWLEVPGTNINYPFMHTDNNEYYLNHSIDKSGNSAGWLFMDYRNDPKSLERNTIIYAHGRQDETMFGSLKRVLSSTWTSDSNNFIVNMSLENENSLWQVFSVYHIPTTPDYIQTDFISDEEFITWANNLKQRSSYDFNVELSAADKILTLSTCYSAKEKMVLHARLIKTYER